MTTLTGVFYMIVFKGKQYNEYYCGMTGWSKNSDGAIYYTADEAIRQIIAMGDDTLTTEQVPFD